ncbi:MAG: hypothetical protein M0Q14_11925 [Tissierellaceae bacterium]|nr:hypothetical protein [Tissierellaceae bacterium]
MKKITNKEFMEAWKLDNIDLGVKEIKDLYNIEPETGRGLHLLGVYYNEADNTLEISGNFSLNVLALQLAFAINNVVEEYTIKNEEGHWDELEKLLDEFHELPHYEDKEYVKEMLFTFSIRFVRSLHGDDSYFDYGNTYVFAVVDIILEILKQS